MTLARVYLALGSNLGDRAQNIARAAEAIARLGRGFRLSPIYETTPFGFSDQPPFVNAACTLWTRLDPFELMVKLQKIEAAAGRRRVFPNAPRLLDIDIVFYGSVVISTPALTIPHPRMAGREFVLRPLADLAPALAHPVLNATVSDLLKSLPLSRHLVRKLHYPGFMSA